MEDSNIEFYDSFIIFKKNKIKNRLLSKKYTLPVIGSSRGGTSALAWLLRESNIFMGDSSSHNHEDPEFLNNIGNKNKIKSIIQQRNIAQDIWGVKVPALSFHMGTLDILMRNPIFIIVIRNIASISRTIMNRDPSGKKTLAGFISGLDHAIRFYTFIKEELRRIESPVIIIEYDKIANQTENFVKQFSQILELDNSSKEEALIKGLMQPGYKDFNNIVAVK